MKRYVRDPHTGKLRELARLSRKTKPDVQETARIAFLRAWLGLQGRGCPVTRTALWLITEGLEIERSLTLKHSLRVLRRRAEAYRNLPDWTAT